MSLTQPRQAHLLLISDSYCKKHKRGTCGKLSRKDFPHEFHVFAVREVDDADCYKHDAACGEKYVTEAV